MVSDKVLSELNATFDRHCDIQFLIEHIDEIGLKDKQKLEALLKFRIFEYHIMLGKLWNP